MTGYGQAKQNIDGYQIGVEIKSVNHRYLECGFRLPRTFSYLEEKLRSMVQASVARGKVEVTLTMETDATLVKKVEIDHGLAAGYVEALRKLNQSLNLPDDLTLSSVFLFRDIFRLDGKIDLEEAHLWQAVKLVASVAMADFLGVRQKEGLALAADVAAHLAIVAQKNQLVGSLAPKTVEKYHQRLVQKMKELADLQDIEESRLLTEAAIFADRVAVDEENIRLESHISQMNDLLQSEEPMGRKMDFLVQEMNREVNTMGAKAQDLDISRLVIDMKAELEKIREQIQNIE